MSEMAERDLADEGILEGEGGCCGGDPFSPAKLLGVAAGGALVALAAYYAYVQMEPDKREALRDSVKSLVRAQIRRWSEGDEEDA